MTQKAVEVILMRQMASYLAIPVVLFDAQGTLLYFNAPAESVIGRRFEETGEVSLAEWYTLFDMQNEAGAPLPHEERPLARALKMRHAVQSVFWIRTENGLRIKVEATAIPLEGQSGRHLGALVTFWEPHKA